jgi:hypothetical protein
MRKRASIATSRINSDACSNVMKPSVVYPIATTLAVRCALYRASCCETRTHGEFRAARDQVPGRRQPPPPVLSSNRRRKDADGPVQPLRTGARQCLPPAFRLQHGGTDCDRFDGCRRKEVPIPDRIEVPLEMTSSISATRGLRAAATCAGLYKDASAASAW